RQRAEQRHPSSIPHGGPPIERITRCEAPVPATVVVGGAAGYRRGSMRIGHAIAALGVALAIASAGVPAAAQKEPPQTAAQKAQFKNAQRLFTKGDHAAALLEFKKIFEETGSPNARLYVARCLKELGRLPEAYDEL